MGGHLPTWWVLPFFTSVFMQSLASDILVNAVESLPGDLKKAVIEEFRTGISKQIVDATIQQKRIASQSGAREFRAIEGVGRLRMRVDPTLYHKWGQKYGYDCWRDNQFLNEIERDNPEVRVKCGGTRLQVGYSGTNKRFSKKY